MLLNVNILNYPYPFNFFFEKLCVFFVQLCVTALPVRSGGYFTSKGMPLAKVPQRRHKETRRNFTYIKQ